MQLKCTEDLLKIFLYIYTDNVEALLTRDSTAICITFVKVAWNLYCLPLTACSDLQLQVSKQKLVPKLRWKFDRLCLRIFVYIMNSIRYI